MKYGTVDLDLFEVLKPWFGEQAEVLRALSLADDGRTLRVRVKSTEELLPDGAAVPDGDMPHYSLEFITTPVLVKFSRNT
ncbi:MAG: hypothetical protein ACREF4_02480 [Gammaproteobacteria bacterium]